MRLLGSGGFISPGNMLPSEWRKPFNLSIGLHIVTLVLAMFSPSLFDRKPRLPEIYTVNLFTATEVAEPPPAKAPAVKKTVAKPVVKKIEPTVKKPAISIKPAEPEVAPVIKTVAKPISLKPVKMKVKVGKTKQEEAADKAKLSKIVQQMKAAAVEKEAKAEAEKAAKDAVSKLVDALKTTAPPGPAPAAATDSATTGQTTSAEKTTQISGPKGTGIEPEFYMKQYLSAVYQKIHDNWVLPDLQNWDNALEAILVIKIRKDGNITDSFFEKKSENIYFNQFVLKAIKESSPLPPFPDKLNKKSLEIGLRFKPGELY
jgi:colicin import membrane protein